MVYISPILCRQPPLGRGVPSDPLASPRVASREEVITRLWGLICWRALLPSSTFGRHHFRSTSWERRRSGSAEEGRAGSDPGEATSAGASGARLWSARLSTKVLRGRGRARWRGKWLRNVVVRISPLSSTNTLAHHGVQLPHQSRLLTGGSSYSYAAMRAVVEVDDLEAVALGKRKATKGCSIATSQRAAQQLPRGKRAMNPPARKIVQ
jgi:hypothetical protein